MLVLVRHSRAGAGTGDDFDHKHWSATQSEDLVDVSVLPSHAIYHRLDLLPPERARVCRQFTQMATLGEEIDRE